MEQQAELVGDEPVAAEPAAEAGALEILDPLLGFAAIDVEVVEREGWVLPGGDDETGVRAFGEYLRLIDDAARPTRRGLD